MRNNDSISCKKITFCQNVLARNTIIEKQEKMCYNNADVLKCRRATWLTQKK
jgi:Zn finger protein HypA/HybF involved in hydrogenase expression